MCLALARSLEILELNEWFSEFSDHLHKLGTCCISHVLVCTLTVLQYCQVLCDSWA